MFVYLKTYSAQAKGEFRLDYVCPFCGYEQCFEGSLITKGEGSALYGIGKESARTHAVSNAKYNLRFDFEQTRQALQEKNFDKSFIRFMRLYCGKCGKLQPWSCYPRKFEGVDIKKNVALAFGLTLLIWLFAFPTLGLLIELPMWMTVLISFLIGFGSIGIVSWINVKQNLDKRAEADKVIRSESFVTPTITMKK